MALGFVGCVYIIERLYEDKLKVNDFLLSYDDELAIFGSLL